MRGLLFGTTLAMATAVAPAYAVVLSFDDGIVAGGGSLTHAAGGPVIGSDIIFRSVGAIDAPANNGGANALSCDDPGTLASETCFFDFTSGALVTEGAAGGPDWEWGAGGTFALTGTLFDPGDVQVATGILLSGTFGQTSASGGAEDQRLQVDGLGVDEKSADMLAYFGLTTTTGWLLANTHIAADGTTFGADGSFSADVTNSDMTNTLLVPEPASMSLLGAGLAGLAWLSRRRRAQA